MAASRGGSYAGFASPPHRSASMTVSRNATPSPDLPDVAPASWGTCERPARGITGSSLGAARVWVL